MTPLELATTLTNACIGYRDSRPTDSNSLCDMFKCFYSYFNSIEDMHLNETKIQCALDIVLCLIENKDIYEKASTEHDAIIKQFDVVLKLIFSQEPPLSVNDQLIQSGF